MCGIAGIFGYKNTAPPADPDELLRIRDYMTKRGPDGEGQWLSEDKRVGLAHRRLSIIDLSERGAQPMSDPLTGSVVTYNGEIYNYKELREELVRRGCRFNSDSDTEVLLHLYREKGPDMLHELRGMFAFAIWEPRRKHLFCARDPYGIKPFYYSDDGRSLRFASQVKALIAGGNVSREVSAAGKTGFYLWGSVPEPWTWFEDVRALPAGCSLSVSENGLVEMRRYDHLANAWNEDVLHDGVSTTEALKTSVSAHLVADVPVGLFLSSGIDSCALLAISRQLGAGPLRCVTLGFDEFRKSDDDETVLAAEMASRCDADHRVVRYTPEQIEQMLPEFFSAMDQPSVDGLNTWLVSRAAHDQGLKVVMTGSGGDELLGGYASFRKIPNWVGWWHGLRFLSSGARQAPGVLAWLSRLPVPPKAWGLPVFGGDWASAYFLFRGIFMPWELKHVMDGQQAFEGLQALRTQETIQEVLDELPSVDANKRNLAFARVALMESSFYLRNQLLRDADWAGMDHSLEIRTPLVDRDLLTQTATQIARLATRKGISAKSVLAEAPNPPLPQQVASRPKTGFSLPISRWLQIPSLKDLWADQQALNHSRCHWSRRWVHSVAHVY